MIFTKTSEKSSDWVVLLPGAEELWKGVSLEQNVGLVSKETSHPTPKNISAHVHKPKFQVLDTCIFLFFPSFVHFPSLQLTSLRIHLELTLLRYNSHIINIHFKFNEFRKCMSLKMSIPASGYRIFLLLTKVFYAFEVNTTSALTHWSDLITTD